MNKMSMEQLGQIIKTNNDKFDKDFAHNTVDKFDLLEGQYKLTGYWSEFEQKNFYTDRDIRPNFCPYTGKKLIINE